MIAITNIIYRKGNEQQSIIQLDINLKLYFTNIKSNYYIKIKVKIEKCVCKHKGKRKRKIILEFIFRKSFQIIWAILYFNPITDFQLRKNLQLGKRLKFFDIDYPEKLFFNSDLKNRYHLMFYSFFCLIIK